MTCWMRRFVGSEFCESTPLRIYLTWLKFWRNSLDPKGFASLSLRTPVGRLCWQRICWLEKEVKSHNCPNRAFRSWTQFCLDIGAETTRSMIWEMHALIDSAQR